jgi:sulfur-oxidizing protein SoxY
MKRRTFLKGTLASGALAVAVGGGLLKPSNVMAAAWPKAAFDAEKTADAINALFGSSSTADNAAINLKAPIQAENGSVVPVKVTAGIDGVEGIAIIVDKNPRPLASSVDLGSGTSGYFSTRIKMGKTSKVTAVVKAGGKLHTASKTVKVTVGGCGG